MMKLLGQLPRRIFLIAKVSEQVSDTTETATKDIQGDWQIPAMIELVKWNNNQAQVVKVHLHCLGQKAMCLILQNVYFVTARKSVGTQTLKCLHLGIT